MTLSGYVCVYISPENIYMFYLTVYLLYIHRERINIETIYIYNMYIPDLAVHLYLTLQRMYTFSIWL